MIVEVAAVAAAVLVAVPEPYWCRSPSSTSNSSSMCLSIATVVLLAVRPGTWKGWNASECAGLHHAYFDVGGSSSGEGMGLYNNGPTS